MFARLARFWPLASRQRVAGIGLDQALLDHPVAEPRQRAIDVANFGVAAVHRANEFSNRADVETVDGELVGLHQRDGFPCVVDLPAGGMFPTARAASTCPFRRRRGPRRASWA